MGLCISAVVFALPSLVVFAGRKESTEWKKEKALVLGGMIAVLSIVAALSALILWVFRAIF